MAENEEEAQHWRRQYFGGRVRNDVLEFSRIQELGTIRFFAEMPRMRVGSPLSLASIERDLAVSPVRLQKYLDILEALFIVFVVRPWHHNIGRAVLQAPKVYFYGTGLVDGDEGIRFENLVATVLYKQAQWQHYVQGREAGLHYIRTKDGAEVDFALSEKAKLTELVECKLPDDKPHRALLRFANERAPVKVVQVVRNLWRSFRAGVVEVVQAARYFRGIGV